MTDRQTIIRGWNDAGDEFLALHLYKVFQKLGGADMKNKVALHDEMIRQIKFMISEEQRHDCIVSIARLILGGSIKSMKSLRKAVASLIIQMSLRELADGQEES